MPHYLYEAERIPNMAEKVNAVGIGSGAAGGIVAKELAEAGLRVVCLERGKTWTGSHAAHDELSGEKDIPGTITKLENLEWNPRSFRVDEQSPVRVGPVGFNAFSVGG